MGPTAPPTLDAVSMPLTSRSTGAPLPVDDLADDVVGACASGGFVLVAEPGAGKSTRVPWFCADAVAGRVVVLQPRRVAARLLADRLASAVGEPVGRTVGRSMRGERTVSGRTRVEFVTEALLTQRLHRDPGLEGIGVVLFDEFHERHLHADLGLAMAIEARDALRPDLVIGVMSATIDAAPISDLLGGAPILRASGRPHPVDIQQTQRPTPDGWAEATATAARSAAASTDGDVLVFCPGRREIREVGRRLGGIPVVELHAGTPAAEVDALHRPAPGRVILATAVAETSVTFPHVRTVVDGGRSRRPSFDPVTGFGRLVTVHTSRFSAEQRSGRAGRVAAGRAVRLWSAVDHELLDDADEPEILRGDPTELAFELSRWGDPDATSLPLLDRPEPSVLGHGRRRLVDLGLTDPDGRLTELGRRVAEVGVGARLGALAVAVAGVDAGRAVRLLATLEERPHDAPTDLEQRLAGTDVRDESRRRWRRRLDRIEVGADAPGTVAEALVVAWPDRIARRRDEPDGSGRHRYLLATGREVRLDDDVLARDWILVVDADADPTTGRARCVLPLDDGIGDELLAIDEHPLRTESTRGRWGPTGRLHGDRVERWGAIELRVRPRDLDRAATADAWDDLVLTEGLGSVVDLDRARALRTRVGWCREQDDTWPDLGVDALTRRRAEWLDLSSVSDRAGARRVDVDAALRALIGWDRVRRLDELAPVRWTPPSGRAVPIEYREGGPTVSLRLQEVLGLDLHPTIGPGRVPLTLELLSPARRPIQVTRDLPGFWRGSYAGVRAEMRGRYTKHPWPEQPWLTDS